MSTTPGAILAPPSKLDLILGILTGALNALTLVPVVGAPAGLAGLLVDIIHHALVMFQQETGKPIDLSKIPQEQLIP